MEDVRTSSLVWINFVRANSQAELKNYIAHSDCKLLHIEKLDSWEVEHVDKPINELVDGIMVYNDNK